MLLAHALPRRSALVLACAALAALPPTAQRDRRADAALGTGPPPLVLQFVSTGFGRILPHRVQVFDRAVELRSFEDLALLDGANVLPPATWPTAAVLPFGAPGNHFVYARFDRALDVDSVLSSSATAPQGLTGRLRVVRLDPLTQVRQTIPGRAFVGGRTYGSPDPDAPGQLLLETWLGPGGGGLLEVLDPRGLGFPGTESPLGFADALVDPATFVFVPDLDGDLTTHETFPAAGSLGVHVQVVLEPEVAAEDGGELGLSGLGSSTVGPDLLPPEVLGAPGSPALFPPDGALDVDVETDLELAFTEPVQPALLGPVPGSAGSGPFATAVSLTASTRPAPFTVLPVSPFDFTRFVVDPVLPLPTSSSSGQPFDCSAPPNVTAVVRAGRVRDLAANVNQLLVASSFATVEGPAVVNAPVSPDTIYVARTGGLSVVDLNGFGGGTGNPQYDIANPVVQGNSNFPNNPNVALQGALFQPPLAVGTCTFDGGSSGVFTLTRDSALDDLLVKNPVLQSVGETALGHALDIAFNAADGFGCQAGGATPCALTGLKRLDLAPSGPNTLGPPAPGQLPIQTGFGFENPISWSPHPNPPPIALPAACGPDGVLGDEPTSVDVIEESGLQNLLLPGPLPLGLPDLNIPPLSLLVPEQNTFFEGPSQADLLADCLPYAYRQQIGHFLYVIDRVAGELVVLNSNRFTVLERIALADPTALAMSPNLDLLAVTSEATDRVLFVDVDPLSASFHQVVHETGVGDGPTGVAWDSLNEDLLVCNTAGGSLSVISAFDLQVRRTVTGFLDQPVDVAMTPRQFAFGFFRNVYFAYVLNANGVVTVFESGPTGFKSFGFDDAIGNLPFVFPNATTIRPDPTDLRSAFWVTHTGPLGPDGRPTGQAGGALTKAGLTAAIVGVVPIGPGERPSFRDYQFGVIASIGEGPDGLTGVPVDLAFDDQRNLGALSGYTTPFSSAPPLAVNSKSAVRSVLGMVRATTTPQFLFVAVPASVEGPGVVDVLEYEGLGRFDTNAFDPGVQSIPTPGVHGLGHWFRP